MDLSSAGTLPEWGMDGSGSLAQLYALQLQNMSGPGFSGPAIPDWGPAS